MDSSKRAYYGRLGLDAGAGVEMLLVPGSRSDSDLKHGETQATARKPLDLKNNLDQSFKEIKQALQDFYFPNLKYFSDDANTELKHIYSQPNPAKSTEQRKKTIKAWQAKALSQIDSGIAMLKCLAARDLKESQRLLQAAQYSVQRADQKNASLSNELAGAQKLAEEVTRIIPVLIERDAKQNTQFERAQRQADVTQLEQSAVKWKKEIENAAAAAMDDLVRGPSRRLNSVIDRFNAEWRSIMQTILKELQPQQNSKAVLFSCAGKIRICLINTLPAMKHDLSLLQAQIQEIKKAYGLLILEQPIQAMLDQINKDFNVIIQGFNFYLIAEQKRVGKIPENPDQTLTPDQERCKKLSQVFAMIADDAKARPSP